MVLYTLTVFHEVDAAPTETVTREAAAKVLDTIPTLLARRPDCFRIHVYAAHAHLFSVECAELRVDA